MRVYVAGPMRGYPEYNIPAFILAAANLRKNGHTVVSPVEVCTGMAPEGVHTNTDYLRHDLIAILTRGVDAIHMLAGWEQSTGALCEAAVALTFSFTFVDQDGYPINSPSLIKIEGGY